MPFRRDSAVQTRFTFLSRFFPTVIYTKRVARAALFFYAASALPPRLLLPATLCIKHPFRAQTSIPISTLCTKRHFRAQTSPPGSLPLCREEQLKNILTVPAIRLPRSYHPEHPKMRVSVDNPTKLLNLPHLLPLKVPVARGNVADELQKLAPRQPGQKIAGKRKGMTIRSSPSALTSFNSKGHSLLPA